MILITGASRGVGQYLLHAYREQGEDVAGTYHTSQPEEQWSALYDQVDVTDFEQVRQWVERRCGDGRLVLVNCSGISYNAFTHKSDPKLWAAVVQTNLLGTYHAIRAALPLMRQAGYGRIINLSSVVGKKPTPGISAYAASKTALWGLAKSVAAENGSLGITCNCINLGYAELGMGVEKVPPAYQEQIKVQIPSGKFCPAESIFQLVEHLRANDYLNGADIDLSGGLV